MRIGFLKLVSSLIFRDEADAQACGSLAMPSRSLSQFLSACRGGKPLVDELLHAVALRFPGHEIALRINAEAMDMVELSRLAAGAADLADLFQRGAIEDRDPFVRAVRDVDKTLLRIGRQRHAERGPGAF